MVSEEFASDFGERVRAAREEVRLSQLSLSKILGCHYTFVAHIEAGRRLPSLETLANISAALQVSADWLLGLSEEQ